MQTHTDLPSVVLFQVCERAPPKQHRSSGNAHGSCVMMVFSFFTIIIYHESIQQTLAPLSTFLCTLTVAHGIRGNEPHIDNSTATCKYSWQSDVPSTAVQCSWTLFLHGRSLKTSETIDAYEGSTSSEPIRRQQVQVANFLDITDCLYAWRWC